MVGAAIVEVAKAAVATVEEATVEAAMEAEAETLPLTSSPTVTGTAC